MSRRRWKLFETLLCAIALWTLIMTYVAFTSRRFLVSEMSVKQFFPKEKENFSNTERLTTMAVNRYSQVNKKPSVNPKMPGQMNQPVIVKKSLLSPEQQKKVDEGWEKNAFNEYASDMIRVHLSLPDMRHPDCQAMKYPTTLPTTSVVMCFHNEAWSVLLRSVHSLLDRSPPHLLVEIILVDDFSDRDELKKPLEEYINKLEKVKLFHTLKREGLIRARLLGASKVQTDTLTFLDSHIEVTEGWLEPLMAPIAQNWTKVTVPVIEAIHNDTFSIKFKINSEIHIGGFDWNLQYTWHHVSKAEKLRRGSKINPTRSPTMAGGLFSISKKFFDYLGQYDPGFDIWGTENLELSFKIWMCGGELYIIPCSHIGHIYRHRSPYSWGNTSNVLFRNSIRLAEVWMDEFKLYYYMMHKFQLIDYGDITERIALRHRLRCKTFRWYLDNIYPEQYIPNDSLAYGEISNTAGPYCVDASEIPQKIGKAVILYPCHKMGGNQFWMWSNAMEIRRTKTCLEYPGGTNVITRPCHGRKGNQLWIFETDGTIHHSVSKKCLEASFDFKTLQMAYCDGRQHQKWTWQRGQPTFPPNF